MKAVFFLLTLVLGSLAANVEVANAGADHPIQTKCSGHNGSARAAERTANLYVALTVQFPNRLKARGLNKGFVAVFYDKLPSGEEEIGRVSNIQSERFTARFAVAGHCSINLLVKLFARGGKIQIAQSKLQSDIANDDAATVVFGGGSFGGGGAGGTWKL